MTLNSTTTVALHPRPTVTSNVQSDSGQKWIERGSTAYRRISVALFLAGFSTFSLLYCVQPLLPAFSTEFAIGATQSSLALSLATGFLPVRDERFLFLAHSHAKHRLSRSSRCDRFHYIAASLAQFLGATVRGSVH
jgi:hypothetical protein